MIEVSQTSLSRQTPEVTTARSDSRQARLNAIATLQKDAKRLTARSDSDEAACRGVDAPHPRRRAEATSVAEINDVAKLPTISLGAEQFRDTWSVTRDENNIFHVTGAKIEKFARRTDYDNYASLNRLRDIMKKLGIRAELTNQGAGPDSIIEIAGHEFTLVEDY